MTTRTKVTRSHLLRLYLLVALLQPQIHGRFHQHVFVKVTFLIAILHWNGNLHQTKAGVSYIQRRYIS